MEKRTIDVAGGPQTGLPTSLYPKMIQKRRFVAIVVEWKSKYSGGGVAFQLEGKWLLLNGLGSDAIASTRGIASLEFVQKNLESIRAHTFWPSTKSMRP